MVRGAKKFQRLATGETTDQVEDPPAELRTYFRDDGVRMVEIAIGQAVTEAAAIRLGLIGGER